MDANADVPYVALSNQELSCINVTSRIKGFEVDSRYHQRLRALTQKSCFKSQKKDIVNQLIKWKVDDVDAAKSHKCSSKKKVVISFDTESSSSDDRHEDFQEVLKDFPSCGNER